MSLFRFNRRPLRLVMLAAFASLTLTGCSMTGLNAADDFSCPMDIGYPCESTAAAYQKSVTGHYALEDEARREVALREQKNADRGLIESLKHTFTSNDAKKDSEAHRIDATMKGGAGETVSFGVDEETVNTAADTAALRLRPSDNKPINRDGRPDYDPAIVVTNLTARPERLPEEIVTIWIAPWTDSEGDFHEGEKIHARVFDARWAAARRRAEEARGGPAVVSLPFAREGIRPVGSPFTRTTDARTGKVEKDSGDEFTASFDDRPGEGAATLEAEKRKMADDLARLHP